LITYSKLLTTQKLTNIRYTLPYHQCHYLLIIFILIRTTLDTIADNDKQTSNQTSKKYNTTMHWWRKTCATNNKVYSEQKVINFSHT